MLIFDLRWLLFLAVMAAVAVLIAALWLDRRLRHGRVGRLALHDLSELEPGLEQAPFGLLVLEGQRTCRYANAYARRLLALPAANCRLPETSWTYLLDADREVLRQEGGAGGRHRSIALPASQPGQAEQPGQFVRWGVTPVGKSDVVLVLDATAEQRAEEAVRSLINDLSHELRTPLATILTHLEVLSLPNISPEIGRQSVPLLKADARRMARLINQMLELGRLESSAEIERRPLDMLTLVGEIVAQVLPQAEERQVMLSFEADAPLPLVRGDGDRLRQVFLNLLDNAVKYSRPGDRVVVSLGREEDGLRCAVRDSGPGIPARHLPHVARRFYRAAPQEMEGSGLGLALVDEILRRHQSHLEIESRTEGPETGTCVRFVLPAL